MQEALNGIVKPGQIGGTISARDHSLGGFSAMSPFTSWTHHVELALWYAGRKGAGGLLLRVPVGAPTQTDEWSWVHSGEDWHDDEVLLRGVRLNVEVFPA